MGSTIFNPHNNPLRKSLLSPSNGRRWGSESFWCTQSYLLKNWCNWDPNKYPMKLIYSSWFLRPPAMRPPGRSAEMLYCFTSFCTFHKSSTTQLFPAKIKYQMIPEECAVECLALSLCVCDLFWWYASPLSLTAKIKPVEIFASKYMPS